jgi:hypothetical protein
VSQDLRASSSVITAGQSVTATDVLTVDSTTNSQARALVAVIPPPATLARTKPKPQGNAKPTGKVLFEDDGKVLARVTVKVIRGVAEAQARLKLKVPGVQTLSAVYVPDVSSKKQGLSAITTTTEVTVLPKAPGKGPGNEKG